VHDKTLFVAAMRVDDKIVRPCASTVATQPQLQPAFLRLSAIISQYCTRTMSDNLSGYHETDEQTGDFKEP
jgi:hypothetical protein